MSGMRAISTTSRRELSSSVFFLQGKAPKEIHAILTETLACLLPGRAKDLLAPLYNYKASPCTVFTHTTSILCVTTNQQWMTVKSVAKIRRELPVCE